MSSSGSQAPTRILLNAIVNYNVNSVVSLPSPLRVLLALVSMIFMITHVTILKADEAIMSKLAIAYRGPSFEGKKYGLQILPSWLRRLMMAVAHALFSGV